MNREKVSSLIFQIFIHYRLFIFRLFCFRCFAQVIFHQVVLFPVKLVLLYTVCTYEDIVVSNNFPHSLKQQYMCSSNDMNWTKMNK